MINILRVNVSLVCCASHFIDWAFVVGCMLESKLMFVWFALSLTLTYDFYLFQCEPRAGDVALVLCELGKVLKHCEQRGLCAADLPSKVPFNQSAPQAKHMQTKPQVLIAESTATGPVYMAADKFLQQLNIKPSHKDVYSTTEVAQTALTSGVALPKLVHLSLQYCTD